MIVIKNPYYSSTPPDTLIFKTIRCLKIQYVKLDQVTIRLRKRDKFLFETCAASISKKNQERAIIFANEVSEVRKLLNMVLQSQLSIERIILRLETIKEIREVIGDLKPSLRMLKEITQQLSNVLPDISGEMRTINDYIGETLHMTSIRHTQPVVPLEVRSPEGEEILEEVSTFLKESMKRKLPEPPSSVIITERVKSTENLRQMIALTADVSEEEMCEVEEAPNNLFLKDTNVQSVSYTFNRSLEKSLLDYAKREQGEVDVDRCATELNAPAEDVITALKNLNSLGKIKIKK